MKKKKIDVFKIINTIILSCAALSCIIPMIHIAAVSFSSSQAASAGQIGLWPVEFSTTSYEFVANRPAFWKAMGVSLVRVILGLTINLILTIITAYPLSKSSQRFKYRTFYAWYFFIPMVLNAGLIPIYMTLRQYGMLDTIWALVLPGSVPIFSVVVLLNFFRTVPFELAESAYIDGASEWTTLWKIYVPVSKPAIATITLFSLVGHWNSWFDGLIYMNDLDKYPLQTYIQTIVVQRNYSQMTREEIQQMQSISDRTVRSAQIFLGALPIIIVYPFLQKYFVKGLTLGGVKG